MVVITVIGLFAFNLFCALIPCDYDMPLPEINVRKKRLLTSELEYPIVKTDYGFVQGYPMSVISGRKISAFEGVKYGRVVREFEVSFSFENIEQS